MFDFKDFVDNLRNNESKKDVIEKYEKYFEPLWDSFKDTLIYKNYLSKFDLQYLDLLLPEYIDEDFDRELLVRLVISSFSSDYSLDFDKETNKMIFVINVSSWEKSIIKSIHELWAFQISRMFEIYIEEQLNLEILSYEEEKEKDVILTQRNNKLEKWNLVVENIKSKKLSEYEENEKQKKLDSLMDQL